ncbi:MAG TPA: hypothetical protein VJR89_00960, partial [Polyangiales bacterium]|nr:hypothetical protein [Polyangiales bacterium]
PLGLALARSGRAEEGLALVQGWLAHVESLNSSGTLVGTAYETAARICLLRGDREGYQHYAQRCAAVWQAGNNRLLNAKLARLFAEGDPQAAVAAEIVSEAASSSVDDAEYETVHSRINECIDARDRARCALTLLLQQAERFTGYLFGASEAGQLSLLAALPEEPSSELVAWTSAWYRAELSASGASQQTSEASSEERRAAGSGSDAVSVPFRFRDREGRVFEALLLAAPRDRALLAAGVLVLEREGPRQRTDKRLLRQIAALMLAHGDCSGVVMDDHSLVETSSQ